MPVGDVLAPPRVDPRATLRLLSPPHHHCSRPDGYICPPRPGCDPACTCRSQAADEASSGFLCEPAAPTSACSSGVHAARSHSTSMRPRRRSFSPLMRPPRLMQPPRSHASGGPPDRSAHRPSQPAWVRRPPRRRARVGTTGRWWTVGGGVRLRQLQGAQRRRRPRCGRPRAESDRRLPLRQRAQRGFVGAPGRRNSPFFSPRWIRVVRSRPPSGSGAGS